MKKEMNFGSGETELFLEVNEINENDEVKVLDYEFNSEYIHRKCGGKQFYRSRSGLSGSGYIQHWKDLIPIGYYRVDTAYNEFQYPEVYNGISIMVPYKTHTEDKREIFYENPVVMRFEAEGTHYIVYCRLAEILKVFSKISDFLADSSSEFKLWGKSKEIIRSFSDPSGFKTEIRVNFFNAFGYAKQNPLEFCRELLKKFSTATDEDFFRYFGMVRNEDGIFKTVTVSDRCYAIEKVYTDPLESYLDSAVEIAGWIPVEEYSKFNLAYRFYRNQVEILTWVHRNEVLKLDYLEGLDKQKLKAFIEDADRMPGDPVSPKYVYTSKTVDKLSFLLRKEAHLEAAKDKLSNLLIKVAEEIAKKFGNQ